MAVVPGTTRIHKPAGLWRRVVFCFQHRRTHTCYTNSMILMLHIMIALSSLLQVSYLLFAPSRTRLRWSYGLMGATLASGTWLVVTNPAHLAAACASGLVYLAAASATTTIARRNLARLRRYTHNVVNLPTGAGSD